MASVVSDASGTGARLRPWRYLELQGAQCWPSQDPVRPSHPSLKVAVQGFEALQAGKLTRFLHSDDYRRLTLDGKLCGEDDSLDPHGFEVLSAQFATPEYFGGDIALTTRRFADCHQTGS